MSDTTTPDTHRTMFCDGDGSPVTVALDMSDGYENPGLMLCVTDADGENAVVWLTAGEARWLSALLKKYVAQAMAMDPEFGMAALERVAKQIEHEGSFLGKLEACGIVETCPRGECEEQQ